MNIEKEINDIKQRNKRVELDKKWETSITRRICICILTYIVVVIYTYDIYSYKQSKVASFFFGPRLKESPKSDFLNELMYV